MSEHKEPTNESEVYKLYQKNVRLSETLQEEILQGSRRGEDPCVLLMKAAKVISLMTGDNDLFSREITNGLRAVYGVALGDRAPLEVELSESRKRLEKIRSAAEQTPEGEDKKRMMSAIHEHEGVIERLEKRLKEGKQ